MRRRHTQATQIPIELARTRVDHAFHKRAEIPHLQRQINSIHPLRGKRRVVHVRRHGVHHGQTHKPADHRFSIDLVDAVNRTKLPCIDLPGRGRAFVFQRRIREIRTARRSKTARRDTRISHRDRDQLTLLATRTVEQLKNRDTVRDVIRANSDLHDLRRRCSHSLVKLLEVVRHATEVMMRNDHMRTKLHGQIRFDIA